MDGAYHTLERLRGEGVVKATGAALEAARALPEVRFVVDHLAKPPIRTGDTAACAEALAPLSARV